MRHWLWMERWIISRPLEQPEVQIRTVRTRYMGTAGEHSSFINSLRTIQACTRDHRLRSSDSFLLRKRDFLSFPSVNKIATCALNLTSWRFNNAERKPHKRHCNTRIEKHHADDKRTKQHPYSWHSIESAIWSRAIYGQGKELNGTELKIRALWPPVFHLKANSCITLAWPVHHTF